MNLSLAKTNFESKDCLICGADRGVMKPLHTQVSLDINYQKEELNEIEIDYLLCENCGAVSQANIPSDEDLDNYYSSTSAHGAESTPRITREFFRKRLYNVLLTTGLDKKDNPKVLEIGCASGEFSSMLIEKGIEVYGIEPGENSSTVATQRGIKVLGPTVAEIGSEYFGAFDLVFSMGTFEHLPAPRSVLSDMMQLAKVNGYIYIDVPDNEVIAEGGRNDWGSNIIVPHLHHFSSQSLWLLVAQNYLTPIFYDRCLDLPYSSQAIIAKKVRPAVYGKENFFGALHAENSMFIKIAQMLNNYLSKVVSPLYWGCGSDLHTLLSTAVIDGSNFKLCDRSEFKVGKHFIGQVILRPEEVGATDLVIVAVLDPRVAASICTEARTLFPESEIISMVDIMLQNEKESSSSQ